MSETIFSGGSGILEPNDPLVLLADLLIRKRYVEQELVVVPFVGAGASASADLPDSKALRRDIYDEVVGETRPDARIRRLLDDEARQEFHEKAEHGIMSPSLSLFEFAAVISKFAYGRSVLEKVIRPLRDRPTRRPLAYELLAHLGLFRNQLPLGNTDTLRSQGQYTLMKQELICVSLLSKTQVHRPFRFPQF